MSDERVGPWLTNDDGYVRLGSRDCACAQRGDWPAQTFSGPGHITLGPPRQLTGHVDLVGGPCPEAKATARTVCSCDAHSAPLGADGNFRIEGLGPGPYGVGVEGCGGNDGAQLQVPLTGAWVKWTLTAQQRTVQIVDERGAPLQGASVTAHREGADFGPLVSDANGEVTFPGGRGDHCARREGWPAQRGESRIALSAPRTLTGQVVATNRECLRATITVANRDCDVRQPVTADELGRFSLDGLTSDVQDVTVTACGHSAAHPVMIPLSGALLTVTVDETKLDFTYSLK